MTKFGGTKMVGSRLQLGRQISNFLTTRAKTHEIFRVGK